MTNILDFYDNGRSKSAKALQSHLDTISVTIDEAVLESIYNNAAVGGLLGSPEEGGLLFSDKLANTQIQITKSIPIPSHQVGR